MLDTIHGGSVLAEALIRKGYDVDALDVYRGGFLSADEARARKYDVITAPVHLDSDNPLLHIQEVISHHEMTAKLCGTLPIPLIEITGSRGKTTTAFAISHVMGRNGIIHTSRGTFHDDTLLFKKSITPASLLFAVTSAEKQKADWIVVEESLGVAGCGCLGILTSTEDYPICSGKRSALAAKLASLKRCSKVLVPAGIEKETGWISVDELVTAEGDSIKYAEGSFSNSLVTIPVYQNALKFAAATALLLGKDPSVLASFHAVEGRMRLYEEDGVPVLDNANSGINASISKEAGTYLKSIAGKDIFLVIGEEKHAVCDGFSQQSIDDVISFLQPKEVFFVSENHLFEEAKAEAIEKAKKYSGSVLLAVKGWR